MQANARAGAHKRRLLHGKLLAAALVCAATPCAATAVHAAPPADKVANAETMAEKASKAFTAGDYPRAAELFFNAWRTDPRPLYLWSLARCEHLAGRRDKALEYYKQFIAAPGELAEKVAPAREYVEAIEAQNAETRAKEAERAERDGDGRLAASLYLDAYKAAPKRVDWLLKAAAAAQSAGDHAIAEAHLRAYLLAAPAEAPDRAAAQARLESIERKRKPAPTAAPADPAPATSPVPPGAVAKTTDSRSNAAAWAAVAGGAVALAGGAWWYNSVREDQQALQAAFAKRESGKIVGISSDEAVLRGSALDLQVAASLGLAGVGALAAGIGGYLLATGPAKVSAAPIPGGMVVAVRF